MDWGSGNREGMEEETGRRRERGNCGWDENQTNNNLFKKESPRLREVP